VLVSRPQGAPVGEYLVSGRRVNRAHLKDRLLAAGLNGEGTDNRLENLMMLCPNCHSQTENFSGRGRKRVEAA
jgi:hypothetical protein